MNMYFNQVKFDYNLGIKKILGTPFPLFMEFSAERQIRKVIISKNLY